MRRLLAVAAGALLLVWPALVNGYPLVFSDTAGLAAMGIEPTMGWDKPWAYGPLILLLHARVSLWGVAAGQALATSGVLWAVARAVGGGGPVRHLVLCAVLAVGSSAPWFVPFVMPDIFAPLVVLGLFLLAWGRLPLWGMLAAGLLAAVGVATHLAHLIVAAACLAPILLLRWRRLAVAAAPLALALAWLLATNAVGNRVLGVSPYGSVFALARLQADGPAAEYLRGVCPAAGYRLCAWSDRLPMDSDDFLWSADGPVWGGQFGPALLAPEASRIVSATIRSAPLEVLRDAAVNTLRQLGRNAVGDAIGPHHLPATVHLLLATYFPAAELRRFEASRQLAGTLPAVAAPLAPLHLVLLALGAAGTLAIIPLAWRRNPPLAGLAAIVLAGVVGNAFATGALSGPHDRYGARIAWLLPLPPLLAVLNAAGRRRPAAASGVQAAMRATSAGVMRTSLS